MSQRRAAKSMAAIASICLLGLTACSSSGANKAAGSTQISSVSNSSGMAPSSGGASTGAGSAGAPAGGAKKLVYFIFTGYTPPYFAPMAQGVQNAASHYPDLQIKVLSANGSASTEISQIKQAQAAGAKGIILNPVDESVTNAAKQASGSIPVVTIDRDVSDPSARIGFIGDNDKQLGSQLATACVDGLKASGMKMPWHVIDLQGTQGSSTAIDREAGIQSVLKADAAKVKVVLDQSANFDTASAQTMVTEYLAKSTDVQAILAANDAMALGAIQALKSHNLQAGKQVLVCGGDAQPESLAGIRAGTQYATVTHSPYIEAFWAVEALDNYLVSKTTPNTSKFPGGDILVPQTVVTKANVASIGPWGTPTMVPALPYGTSQKYPVTKQ